MTPRELKEAYARGENITSLLRTEQGASANSEEIIEIAYDLQAGRYIAALEKPGILDHKIAYGREIAGIISSLGALSVLEAGIGEATTLAFVLDTLGSKEIQASGFDISWSRVRHAAQFLETRGIRDSLLAVASIFHIPYADSAVDVVYTSHTIEPNGGREREILAELYRVTKRYLVLIEPGYELASDEARARMESLGYCRNLPGHAADLGMKVLRHELFPHSANPLNPTAITVIEKDPTASLGAADWVCPKYRTPLETFDDCEFSEEAMRAYPRLGGIPCLRIEDGIIASQYKNFRNPSKP